MKQEELKSIAEKCATRIVESKTDGSYAKEPFQYIIMDEFIPVAFARDAMDAFPPMSDETWDHTHDEGIEVKSRTTWKSEFDIPETLVDAIRVFNSAPVLKAIGEVFDIPKLMPDPYFSGGGLNVSEKGGHLDVHVDGNYHDASGMNRRVNLLLYLNPNWQEDWGGEFGVYAEDGEELVKAIEPLFNRCVIFDSHDKSYHGLPNPINFPADDPRRSIILYYYTVAPRPTETVSVEEPHSALWRSKGFVDKRGNKSRSYK